MELGELGENGSTDPEGLDRAMDEEEEIEPAIPLCTRGCTTPCIA